MESSSDKPIVLVTGASGYVAGWVIHYLIEAGKYKVRGTVRDPSNESRMKLLKDAFKENYDQIEFVKADITKEESIKEAIKDVTYVIHVASPLPAKSPKNAEKEVIGPAVDGTVGVLRSCVGTGVKKVIITSSALTIANHPKGAGLYGHDEVVQPTKSMNAYYLSKIRAEKAGFDFMKELDGKNERTFDMCTINPGIISGPPLIPNVKGAALETYAASMQGKFKQIPQVYYSHADVRDAALAHVNAIEKGENGKRYAISSGVYKMVEFFEVMKAKYNPMGYKVSTKEIGTCMIKTFALINIEAKNLKWQWNIKAGADGSLAEKELGIKYTPMEKSFTDMCDTFIELKLIPEPKKK